MIHIVNSLSSIHHYPSTVPGLGSTDDKCITGRVVYSSGLHAAGITAMVGFCQAKAAQDFPSSWPANKVTSLNPESILSLS